MLVVRALKISQLTDGGMPPTYDSMHKNVVIVWISCSKINS